MAPELYIPLNCILCSGNEISLDVILFCVFFPFSQLEYKAKYEETKFKSHLPPDYPFFIQSRVNAFNLSDVSKLYSIFSVFVVIRLI